MVEVGTLTQHTEHLETKSGSEQYYTMYIVHNMHM